MSLTQFRNSVNNSKKDQMSRKEDDSWEIRAFEKDTIGNMLGCTWPPQFYTCTFCRREFRSAQALGGHMNVHRRDRVKLHHQVSPMLHSSTVTEAHQSSIFLPAAREEFVMNGGLCLVYSMSNPNSVLVGREMKASAGSSSPLTSDSPNLAADKSSNATSPWILDGSEIVGSVTDLTPIEEIDLELRLGWG